MSDGHLASATFSDGAWRFSDHGGQISGSPTAVGPAAWARGRAGDLQFFDGTGWSSKGGRLE